MYRVFEALDELVTIVEEARGVPMTSGCVVSRGDVLELLDDVRDAIPSELDDAQDVLDHRDEVVTKAQTESDKSLSDARSEAQSTVSEARTEADQVLADARERAEEIVASARAEAEQSVNDGRREYEDYIGQAQSEADRMVQAGRAAYEQSVHEGRSEQARLIAETEVVQESHVEAKRIVDEAHEDAERLRGECDSYVDARLADFEDLLGRTLRTVGKGRQQLRSPMGAPYDYEEWNPVAVNGSGREH
ncbi:DivIVA domain-containing protein [Allosaccharopolyspora coralli]|uniref:DivIVA domain-containing protein n=1 Tax=Allosaccharopolyspora coralli TaxID=2665642 RepID=A0A5Q3QCF0_9PSEU|nr:DivIVA domain-containing protein [Allosaccharopolyspora coralli]QGK72371.1 DivIVA domain-containing protein [Allosaccharopolyspora coralli]